MEYQAHRGVANEFPENTMPAFIAAYEQGYQVIELDPLFTADGECVVFHDRLRINRTCRMPDGTEIPEEISPKLLTLAQLQSYDAGVFMGEQFRGVRVPLLEEAVKYIAKVGLLVKIDNVFGNFAKEQKEKLFDILEASGVRAAFTCKNEEMIRTVLARFPKAEIHYDGPCDETVLPRIKALVGDNALTMWVPLDVPRVAWCTVPKASAELCAKIKEYGKLGIWLLHEREELEQAEAFGADIIETNGALKPKYS